MLHARPAFLVMLHARPGPAFLLVVFVSLLNSLLASLLDSLFVSMLVSLLASEVLFALLLTEQGL
jgi:hypothetical protein